MAEEYVWPYKSISLEVKEKVKKKIKAINDIPYVCYEIEKDVWACDGEVDPAFKPKIPKGALRGDVSMQLGFCVQCHKPKFYYLDIPFKCACCGKNTVFSASEQKRWFEELRLTSIRFQRNA